MDSTGLFASVAGVLLADAAARFAVSGVPVFPCVPAGKRPLTVHGFRDATANPAQVARWWRRWPDANIGIPTGTPSGIDVVDVDVHASGSGFVGLCSASDAGLAAGWAALVRTPSGGLHLYYPAEQKRPQASWGLGEAHIDFRGTGGYVVAPPSRVLRPDGTASAYGLIATGHDIRSVDSVALRDFLRPPRDKPTTNRQAISFAEGRRIVSWLERQQEGSRNRALFWAACRYAENHIPEDTAQESLRIAAERVGLPEREIVTTIRSAYRSTIAPSSSRTTNHGSIGLSL